MAQIKDLPLCLQELVFANQEKQGNKRSLDKDISNMKSRGNFDWDVSIEGNNFWSKICDMKWLSESHSVLLFELAAKFPDIKLPGFTSKDNYLIFT